MEENNQMGPDYTYRARIRKVVDGDTVDVDIDLGFNTWMMNQRLRLAGIDTPELRGTEKTAGLEVKAYVQEVFNNYPKVIIETKKDSKGMYGRWIATIWYQQEDGTWINLNQSLLDQGMAEEYR